MNMHCIENKNVTSVPWSQTNKNVFTGLQSSVKI